MSKVSIPPMLRATLPAIASSLLLIGLARGAADLDKAAALGLLRQIDQGFIQVFEKVVPSVVVIEATKADEDEVSGDARKFEFFFRDRDGEESGKGESPERPRLPRQSRSEGSGFIIAADGFILTNQHVVADAEKLDVRLKDGRHFPAKLVGADDKTDIAVLKIDAKDLPAASMGDSEALRVGQLVCAIGTPYNQDYSFTCGWVSGKGRTNLLAPTSKSILYEDYIQTDAFINPGNSGGPLFDVEGKVIGMNTLINGIGRGLAFAIPSAMLVDVSQQLIASGKVRRSWLGVRIETLADNATLREHLQGIEHGVVVDTIEANAPAYKSDLRPTDVITEVDGVAVSLAKDLQKEIVRKKVGQVVQLTVWRAGKTLQIPVTTGELPTEVMRVATTPAKSEPRVQTETYGMKLKDGASGGATVERVTPDSAAAKAGVREGDLVTDVETRPVKTAAAVLEAIATSDGKATKKGILLNLERNGKRTYAVIEPGD